MEIGIDSFASAMYGSEALGSVDAMEQLIDRIVVIVTDLTFIHQRIGDKIHAAAAGRSSSYWVRWALARAV